ncbi:Hypothetical protein A7982_02680 [Minicystis rosea]|nr:Hypothetical protein A7982_02680 [Minicystis rosea]
MIEPIVPARRHGASSGAGGGAGRRSRRRVDSTARLGRFHHAATLAARGLRGRNAVRRRGTGLARGGGRGHASPRTGSTDEGPATKSRRPPERPRQRRRDDDQRASPPPCSTGSCAIDPAGRVPCVRKAVLPSGRR